MYLEKTVSNQCMLNCGCMLILMIIKLYDYVNDDIIAILIVVCMNVNVFLHRA